MRKLIYYVATSADGFISRPDGSISDFGFEGEHVAELLSEYPESIPTHLRDYLDVTGDNQHFDTVLMGRHTYEVGVDAGITSPYQHLRQYVFSSTLGSSPDPAVTLVSSDAIDVVRQLKQEAGDDIWLCGGSRLASALFSEIDQLIVKQNPFLIGAGKPLFAEEIPKTELQLRQHQTWNNGFSLLTWDLVRSE